MSFNKNLEEIEKLLEKARKRKLLQDIEMQKQEIGKGTDILSNQKQVNIEKSTDMTDEENNRFVQHLLEEGKVRCQVKLAKPIEINKEV